MDQQIVTAIEEYLHFKDFRKTLTAFSGDVEADARVRNSTGKLEDDATPLAAVSRNFMTAFDAGAGEEFFYLWTKHVPAFVRQSDPVATKLEFYLHVHFALAPWRHIVSHGGEPPKAAVEAMQAFRTYLAQRGKLLAQASEFLPYYALPYVPNPVEHPSFRPLFESDWVADLRGRFERFIEVMLRSVRTPELYARFSSNMGDLESIKQHFQARDNKLRLVAHSVLSVCDELCQMLEAAASGPGFTGSSQAAPLLSAAYAKFDEFRSLLADTDGDIGSQLTPKAEIQSPARRSPVLPPPNAAHSGAGIGAGAASQARRAAPEQPRMQVPQQPTVSPTVAAPQPAPAQEAAVYPASTSITPAALNYRKIQSDIISLLEQANEDTEKQPEMESKAARRVCLLLQALRWRLTKTRPASTRRWVLHTFINSDLLQCGTSSSSLLSGLLFSPHPNICEAAVRLVNAVCSEASGRSYLLGALHIIEWLIAVMREHATDTLTRQHALGALQKFSLRREPQSIMIRRGCVEWLVAVLRRHTHALRVGDDGDTLTEYSIEYSTALLMNLSLRTEGKAHAASDKVKTLDMLTDYLESENTQVRTYVNGTLYSVLSHPVLKQRALSMGIDDILRGLMPHSEEQFQKQIQYILEQLESAAVDDAPSDDEDEDEDEDEEYDDEDDEDDLDEDQDDMLKPMPNERSGEDLLCAAYLADGGGAAAAEHEAKSVGVMLDASAKPRRTRQLSQEGSAKLRPVTPGGRNLRKSARQPPALELQTRERLARTPPGDENGESGSLSARHVDANEEYVEIFQTRAKLARTPAISQRGPSPPPGVGGGRGRGRGRGRGKAMRESGSLAGSRARRSTTGAGAAAATGGGGRGGGVSGLRPPASRRK